MRNHPDSPPDRARSTWPTRAPLVLAAALIALITGVNFARLIPAASPRDPGEATEVIEAWRSLNGLPVYERYPDGHATHFYGALVPWVQGRIFAWVGPNNVSGRVLTLVSALALITLIAAVTRTRGATAPAIVAWAALLGLNHRTGQYYVENRPDLTALFFTALAMVLMGVGLERRRWASMTIGIACLILGFFFKQTAIIFAAVPMVALVARGRRPSRDEVFLAVAPMAAMAGVMLALRVFFPTIHFYMVAIPGSYGIDWSRAIKAAWRLMLQSPLFLVLLADWLAADGGSLRKDARIRWIMAVLAVSVPFCTVAYGKFGGVSNSLLPALLGIIAFCALRLPIALGRLEGSVASLPARAALGALAALLLLMTIFPQSDPLERPFRWNDRYDDVIAAVSRLPGTVVCPKDPTIPMYAKGHAGRGLFPELDCHPDGGAWARTIPRTIAEEVRSADFVVDLRDYWDDRMGEKELRGLGFVPADDLLPGVAAYRLWRRGPDVSRSTAWNAAASRP